MITHSTTSVVIDRRGLSTVELLAASVLLATVGTFLVPFVTRVSQFNENIADRELAIREAANVVERLRAGQKEIQLSDAAQTQLDSPKLNVASEVESESGLQKSTVSLTWTDRVGQRVSPVELVYWSKMLEGEE